MAIVYQTFDTTGPGVRITLADFDDLVVEGTALIGSSNADGVVGPNGFHEVLVRGTVSGDAIGIRLGDNITLDANNTVRVASTGLVYGGDAAISLEGIASIVVNDGTITGDSNGILIGGIGTTTSRIVNFGLIEGEGNGILVAGGTTESVELFNAGTIRGADSFDGDDGSDSVVNRGTMIGTVRLRDGADTFDNRGGTIEGTAFGGFGADTFLPGDGAEDFDGGAGFDTLDFRGGAGVTVSLRDGAGTGRAEGDTYLGFERVLGSQGSADTLLGDDADNVLVGLGGDDILQGAGGADRLNGAAGIDRLRGGAGPDTFVYSDAFAGGDVILDYGNVAGNNDTVAILAAGFGAGLVAGALAPGRFRSRADNLAQDADDRFIFRTTDATLWFDANGSGAGGLTLLADLQAGAAVTAADILLI